MWCSVMSCDVCNVCVYCDVYVYVYVYAYAYAYMYVCDVCNVCMYVV